MYLSHVDGDPITDPRTLKSSTKTCAFENLYGAFRSVFLYFESTIGRLHILAEIFSCTSWLSSIATRLLRSSAALPKTAHHFW